MTRSRNPLSTIPEVPTDHPMTRESILFLDDYLPIDLHPHSSNQTPRLSPPPSPEQPTPSTQSNLLSRIVRSIHAKLTSLLHLRSTDTTNNSNNEPKPAKRDGPSEENLAEMFTNADGNGNVNGNGGEIDERKVEQQLDFMGSFLRDLDGLEGRRGRRRWWRFW